jgi:hypothetical protein
MTARIAQFLLFAFLFPIHRGWWRVGECQVPSDCFVATSNAARLEYMVRNTLRGGDDRVCGEVEANERGGFTFYTNTPRRSLVGHAETQNLAKAKVEKECRL